MHHNHCSTASFGFPLHAHTNVAVALNRFQCLRLRALLCSPPEHRPSAPCIRATGTSVMLSRNARSTSSQGRQGSNEMTCWWGVLIVRWPAGPGRLARAAHRQPAKPMTTWAPASAVCPSGPRPTGNGRPVARRDASAPRRQAGPARHSKGQGHRDSMTRRMVGGHDRRGPRRTRYPPVAGRVVSVWIV